MDRSLLLLSVALLPILLNAEDGQPQLVADTSSTKENSVNASKKEVKVEPSKRDTKQAAQSSEPNKVDVSKVDPKLANKKEQPAQKGQAAQSPKSDAKPSDAKNDAKLADKIQFGQDAKSQPKESPKTDAKLADKQAQPAKDAKDTKGQAVQTPKDAKADPKTTDPKADAKLADKQVQPASKDAKDAKGQAVQSPKDAKTDPKTIDPKADPKLADKQAQPTKDAKDTKGQAVQSPKDAKTDPKTIDPKAGAKLADKQAQPAKDAKDAKGQAVQSPKDAKTDPKTIDPKADPKLADKQVQPASKDAKDAKGQAVQSPKDAKTDPKTIDPKLAEKGKADASKDAKAAQTAPSKDSPKLAEKTYPKMEAGKDANASKAADDEKMGSFKKPSFANSEPKLTKDDVNKASAQNDQTPAKTQPADEQTVTTVSQEKRIRTLESQVADLQAKSGPRRDPFSAIPQTATGIYATGEYLLWRFSEGGTEYAIQTGQPTPASSDGGIHMDIDVPNGHTKSVDFDFTSGYRVGVGYHFKEKGWDLYVDYLNLNSDDNDDESTCGVVDPFLIYQRVVDVGNATNARADWKIHFQYVDAEIARRFFISRTLQIRPHFGLKWVHIQQKTFISYANTNPDFTGDTFGIPVGQTFTINERQSFRGVGIRAGANTVWDFWDCGFGFYGRADVDLIVGRLHAHQVQNQVHPVTLERFTPICLDSNFENRVVPAIEIEFGLKWDRGFNNDKWRLGFNVGFESQYYWRINQMEHWVNTNFNFSPPAIFVRPTEDLGMYGLVVGGRIDF